MKCIATICLFNLFVLSHLAQDKKSIVWIPEKFIDSLTTNGNKEKYNSYLSPIESIICENGKYFIQTYRGMVQPLIKAKNLESNKFTIKGLSLNLNYFSKRTQDSLNNLQFFVSVYNDSLVVEVNSHKKIDRVKYIKEWDNYKFDELRKVKRILLLKGKYIINDPGLGVLESGVELMANGTIKNSSQFSLYKCIKYQSYDGKNLYDLVEFYSKNGKVSKKLAIAYSEPKRMWLGYEYQTVKNKYKIRVFSKPVLKLERM